MSKTLILILFIFYPYFAHAQNFEVLTVGNCRGLFKHEEFANDPYILFRNPNASIQGNGVCTVLIRTKGKKLKDILLYAQRSRYDDATLSKSFKVSRTSTGYAVNFKYYSDICFYYIEAYLGKRKVAFEFVNSTTANTFACHGAV